MVFDYLGDRHLLNLIAVNRAFVSKVKADRGLRRKARFAAEFENVVKNAEGSQKSDFLRSAIKSQNFRLVKHFSRFSPNNNNEKERLIDLSTAILSDNLEISRYLISKFQNFDAERFLRLDSDLLDTLVMEDKAEMIRLLLRRENAISRNANVFAKSIIFGSKTVLGLCLDEFGFGVNDDLTPFRNHGTVKPVKLAGFSTKSAEIMSYLMERGAAELNAEEDPHRSLREALRESNAGFIAALFERNPDLDFSRNPCPFQYLMDFDEDIRVPFFKGGGFDYKAEFVRVLKSAGAEIDDRDESGNTALMLAAESEYCFNNVREFLKLGASTYITNFKGENAMDIALKNGNNDIVDVLLEAQRGINK